MFALAETWVITLRVIFSALFQGGRAGSHPVHCLSRGPASRVTDCGDVTILLPGCRAIAGPLVLFRLKREGFSCCSARATAEGLSVTCRR